MLSQTSSPHPSHLTHPNHASASSSADSSVRKPVPSPKPMNPNAAPFVATPSPSKAGASANRWSPSKPAFQHPKQAASSQASNQLAIPDVSRLSLSSASVPNASGASVGEVMEEMQERCRELTERMRELDKVSRQQLGAIKGLFDDMIQRQQQILTQKEEAQAAESSARMGPYASNAG